MERLQALRKEMAVQGLDAVFLQQRENILYFTGFTGTTGGLYVSADIAALLVDSRYIEQAKKQSCVSTFLLIDRPWQISSLVDDAKTIGFEATSVTVELFRLLKAEAPERVQWLPIDETVAKLRAVKDETEIEKIKTAVKIADSAFHHILPFIKEGVYEIDIANELDFFMRKQGATGPSFDFIVATAERSALPHGVAGRNKIQAHEPLLMDFGCIYENYCSDITRTVFLGDPGEDTKMLYYTVLEGQKRGYANSLVGKPICFAEQAVRSFFDQQQLDRFFGHSLGHGVGLEIHEAPAVNRKNEAKFKNGMVYTIEPGLYIPEACGIRIEDTVLMTYQGPVALTESPKELMIL